LIENFIEQLSTTSVEKDKKHNKAQRLVSIPYNGCGEGLSSPSPGDLRSRQSGSKYGSGTVTLPRQRGHDITAKKFRSTRS
jgi:hypothetical protein